MIEPIDFAIQRFLGLLDSLLLLRDGRPCLRLLRSRCL